MEMGLPTPLFHLRLPPHHQHQHRQHLAEWGDQSGGELLLHLAEWGDQWGGELHLRFHRHLHHLHRHHFYHYHLLRH